MINYQDNFYEPSSKEKFDHNYNKIFNMDIHTHKANALAGMRAVIALDWSIFLIKRNITLENPMNEMYKQSLSLQELELREELRKCQTDLNEYFNLLGK